MLDMLNSSSLFAHLRLRFMKVHNFRKYFAGGYGKSGIFQTFNAILLIGSLVCFVAVLGSSYFYLLPSYQPAIVQHNASGNGFDSNTSSGFLSGECDLFHGRWVIDETYPLYDASECPFAERGFNCLANGRRDKGYLKWRWKPKNCEIPRFDVHKILEFLRGKKVVFVGDSLSRTQWESMICMLMTGVEDKKSVYEVNGNQITKQIRYLGVRFESFNFIIEFYRSVFLVQPGPVPRRAPKRVKMTLKLDQLDTISRKWIDSDFLIFNSGHWWTATKLFEIGSYFQVGGRMKLGMPINNAFKTALTTWQSWIENNINTNRTHVFFRTFEASHWSGGRQNCKVTRQPQFRMRGRERSPISDAIINAVKNLSIPVTLLHVTPMGASRSDAHVGTWSDNPQVPDCSHWCLPGVPDMWNELLFSFILLRQENHSVTLT